MLGIRLYPKPGTVRAWDCGVKYPRVCMDFDHVRGVKQGHVTEMAKRGLSVAVVRAEMDKCEVVCSNCHRIRTKNRILERQARKLEEEF
jgi:hypothetical protein